MTNIKKQKSACILFSTPRFKYTFSIPGKYKNKRKNKQRESDIIMHKTMAGRKRKAYSMVEILKNKQMESDIINKKKIAGGMGWGW